MGGRLKFFLENWFQICRDLWVRQVISGFKLELHHLSPLQASSPSSSPRLSTEQEQVLDVEVQELVQKNAIREADVSTPGFYSQAFAVPKKGGGWRPVINLKRLNNFVLTPHFKMESIQNPKDVLLQGDYMAKIDLKDAYLTVPMHPSTAKYLRFQWKGTVYEFTSLPFRLAPAPLVFTKLMKPVVSLLRKWGIRILLYLDDMLIMAKSPELLKQHLQVVTTLLAQLGFVLNLKKCVTSPTQIIEFLGFLINSITMTLSLPSEKVGKLQKECRHTINLKSVSGRHLAHLIGMMTSCIPAIQEAPLHYRALQRSKTAAVGSTHPNFDNTIQLSREAITDLRWWIDALSADMCRPISPPTASLTLETDASKQGWGAFCRESTLRTGGPWSPQESQNHISWLELMAAFLAVQCFARYHQHCHIQIYMDNTVAIAYINQMGGTHSRKLCHLALQFWDWCLHKNVTIHAEHIPGRVNVIADHESRHMTDTSDWQLNKRIFRSLQQKFGPFTVDLFASFRNTQLKTFFSWKPDPRAAAVDALAQEWKHHNPYMFPPFALIGRALQKVKQEKLQFALLIAPIWPAQPWYSLLLSMLISHPIVLPDRQDLLTNLQNETHPMIECKHMILAAWPLSGVDLKIKSFQKTLLRSYVPLGENPHRSRTNRRGNAGVAGAVNGKLIQFQPL